VKKITYYIKQGPTDLFSIDPESGKIKTTKGLDFETENQYILIIGTEENNSTRAGSTTKVTIDVEVIWKQFHCSPEKLWIFISGIVLYMVQECYI
jgi:hypothetical protein